MVREDTFKRFSRTLGAAPTTSGQLGYVTAIDSQGTTTITASTIIGTISIPVAGVYVINVVGIIKVGSVTPAVATMYFGGITEIGFGVVSSSVSNDFYQFAVGTNLIKVSANYTQDVTIILSSGFYSQGFLRYNYVRIA